MAHESQADHPRFQEALRMIDAGAAGALRELLTAEPALVHARSTSTEPPYEGYFHGATLLHHVAGNPIRGDLPDAIVDVTRVLLEAGADPDAPCGGGPAQPDTGGGTTLGLVASGARAHQQGHTEALIDVLLRYGAKLDPDGGLFLALYHTVEHRGQRDVARMLHDRGVRADLPTAAGLGRIDLMEAFFDSDASLVAGADDVWRRTVRGGAEADAAGILADALLAASVNGWPDAVAWLLDRGAPLGSFRPWGPFQVTALHGAAWAGWPEVVRLLVERGADPSALDPSFGATPRGWAEHCDRHDVLAVFDELV